MSTYLLGLVWVSGAMIVAGSLLAVVRRYVSEEHRHASDESAGRVFTVVAGLLAVLTAFVLITLFTAVGTARSGSYQEADSLVAVYWDAGLLPPAARDEIQQQVVSYTNTVVDQEWPNMRGGEAVDTTGQAQLARIHATIAAYVPTTYPQEDRQTQLTNDLSTVYQARQQRLAAATSRVNVLVWSALIVGAVLAVGVTCLFGGEKLWTHVVITSVFAGIITVLLFTAYQLQDPFSGAVHISPAAFSAALNQFG
jgi:hypothetical protein